MKSALEFHRIAPLCFSYKVARKFDCSMRVSSFEIALSHLNRENRHCVLFSHFWKIIKIGREKRNSVCLASLTALGDSNDLINVPFFLQNYRYRQEVSIDVAVRYSPHLLAGAQISCSVWRKMQPWQTWNSARNASWQFPCSSPSSLSCTLPEKVPQDHGQSCLFVELGNRRRWLIIALFNVKMQENRSPSSFSCLHSPTSSLPEFNQSEKADKSVN